MGSQPQNPEFRINPENFYPCTIAYQFVQYVLKDNFNNLIVFICLNRIILFLYLSLGQVRRYF